LNVSEKVSLILAAHIGASKDNASVGIASHESFRFSENIGASLSTDCDVEFWEAVQAPAGYLI
jgi:hypothetical protein